MFNTFKIARLPAQQIAMTSTVSKKVKRFLLGNQNNAKLSLSSSATHLGCRWPYLGGQGGGEEAVEGEAAEVGDSQGGERQKPPKCLHLLTCSAHLSVFYKLGFLDCLLRKSRVNHK